MRRFVIFLAFLFSVSWICFAFDVPSGDIPAPPVGNIPEYQFYPFSFKEPFFISYGMEARAMKPAVSYNNGKFLVAWFKWDGVSDSPKGVDGIYFQYFDREGMSIADAKKLVYIPKTCSSCDSHLATGYLHIVPYEDDFVLGWTEYGYWGTYIHPLWGRSLRFYRTDKSELFSIEAFKTVGQSVVGLFSDIAAANWGGRVIAFSKAGVFGKSESGNMVINYFLGGCYSSHDCSVKLKVEEKHYAPDALKELFEMKSYLITRNFAVPKNGEQRLVLWQDRNYRVNLWMDFPQMTITNITGGIRLNEYYYVSVDCVGSKCLGLVSSLGVMIDTADLMNFPVFVVDSSMYGVEKVRGGDDIFLVLWISTQKKLLGKFITLDGKALGSPFVISEHPNTFYGYDMAYDPENRRFFVVFDEINDGKMGVYGIFISEPEQDLHLSVQGGKVYLKDVNGTDVSCEGDCDFKVVGNNFLNLRAEGDEVKWGGDCSICNKNKECKVYINKVTNCSAVITVHVDNGTDTDNGTAGADNGTQTPELTLPLPSQMTFYRHAPVDEPVVDTLPSACKPFGVGRLSEGKVRLKVSLPKFEGPVDIYVAIYPVAIDPGVIYLLDAGNSLVSLSLSDRNLVSRLPKWKEAVQGAVEIDINDVLLGGHDIELSQLPPGPYYFYVLVQPAGEQGISNRYYLWETSFTR
ncbi:MAG: hypothetical protein GXO44_03890 [Deferribacteres bacterium]|nr:hypothetical protein [Deferribacteres bacterium]